MAGDEFSTEESLAAELRELRPVILRQQRAEQMPPDPAFARMLRARLVGTPETVPIRERVRRIIAVLMPMPQPRFALGGVRGAGGAQQPITYTAEDVQISLSFESGAAGVTVRGMIFAPDQPARTVVSLLDEVETPKAHSEIDEFGAFTLRAPSGTYTLRIGLEDREIEIAKLALNV